MADSRAVFPFLMYCACLSLLNCVQAICNGKQCCSDGKFYWRDYDGRVPSDAIPGGSERNGNPTYIGQVLHHVQPNILPGEIRRSDGVIYYQMSGALNATKNVKILCSRHPEFYEWVWTDIDQMGSLEERKTLVKGGFEDKEVVFIGRVEDEGEKVVGKINSRLRDRQWRAFYAAHVQKDIQSRTFEVLTYNPKGTSESDNSDIFNRFSINVFS